MSLFWPIQAFTILYIVLYLAWDTCQDFNKHRNHQTFLQSLDKILKFSRYQIPTPPPPLPLSLLDSCIINSIIRFITFPACPNLLAIIRLISRAWDGAGRTIVFHGTWHWFFFYPWTSNWRFFRPPHATVSIINDIPLSMSNMFLSCSKRVFFLKFNSSTTFKEIKICS